MPIRRFRLLVIAHTRHSSSMVQFNENLSGELTAWGEAHIRQQCLPEVHYMFIAMIRGKCFSRQAFAKGKQKQKQTNISFFLCKPLYFPINVSRKKSLISNFEGKGKTVFHSTMILNLKGPWQCRRVLIIHSLKQLWKTSKAKDACEGLKRMHNLENETEETTNISKIRPRGEKRCSV